MLHIGDIHYKEIDKEDGPVDKKDILFSEKLGDVLPKRSYEIIIKKLMGEIDNSPIAILLSGDLSTYGKGYKECLTFLKERIPSNFFKSKPCPKIFIVPGNHDVDRNLFSKESILPKFEPISEALQEKNFPEVPVSKVNAEEIHDGSILIISVNSCVGCGERRYFPNEIRNVLSDYLDNEDKDQELCYEQIDTPIITTEDVDSVVQYIESSGDECLPIILTHHNLLPQKIPRIAMYTELLNSGYIRERLLTLNRPIIFLHGHIHDDPLEIISSSKFKKSKIICISAPLLLPNKIFKSTKLGFNTIKIIYGCDGIPIGCEITYFRMSGITVEKEIERIRFWDPPNSIALITPNAKTVLNYINGGIYLSELKNNVEENGGNFSIEEIEEFVDNLSWLGLVEYDRKGPIKMRSVQKVVP